MRFGRLWRRRPDGTPQIERREGPDDRRDPREELCEDDGGIDGGEGRGVRLGGSDWAAPEPGPRRKGRRTSDK